MAKIKRKCYPPLMPARSCRVTVKDMEGTEHTVTVTASTLYEAVALGLVSLRGEEWVTDLPGELSTVRVTAVSVPVEHSVKLRDFRQWVERHGGSPRDVSARGRIRKILGLPTP
jgi:hypothetical protein